MRGILSSGRALKSTPKVNNFSQVPIVAPKFSSTLNYSTLCNRSSIFQPTQTFQNRFSIISPLASFHTTSIMEISNKSQSSQSTGQDDKSPNKGTDFDYKSIPKDSKDTFGKSNERMKDQTNEKTKDRMNEKTSEKMQDRTDDITQKKEKLREMINENTYYPKKGQPIEEYDLLGQIKEKVYEFVEAEEKASHSMNPLMEQIENSMEKKDRNNREKSSIVGGQASQSSGSPNNNQAGKFPPSATGHSYGQSSEIYSEYTAKHQSEGQSRGMDTGHKEHADFRGHTGEVNPINSYVTDRSIGDQNRGSDTPPSYPTGESSRMGVQSTAQGDPNFSSSSIDKNKSKVASTGSQSASQSTMGSQNKSSTKDSSNRSTMGSTQSGSQSTMGSQNMKSKGSQEMEYKTSPSGPPGTTFQSNVESPYEKTTTKQSSTGPSSNVSSGYGGFVHEDYTSKTKDTGRTMNNNNNMNSQQMNKGETVGQKINEKYQETTEKAKEKMQDVTGKAKEKAQDVSRKAQDVTETAKEKMQDVTGKAKEKAENVWNKAEQAVDNVKNDPTTKEKVSSTIETIENKVKDVAGAVKEKAEKMYNTVTGSTSENSQSTDARAKTENKEGINMQTIANAYSEIVNKVKDTAGAVKDKVEQVIHNVTDTTSSGKETPTAKDEKQSETDKTKATNNNNRNVKNDRATLNNMNKTDEEALKAKQQSNLDKSGKNQSSTTNINQSKVTGVNQKRDTITKEQQEEATKVYQRNEYGDSGLYGIPDKGQQSDIGDKSKNPNDLLPEKSKTKL